MNGRSVWASTQSILVHLYALRVQVIGFLLLWPVAGWAFQTALLRGLRDVGTGEAGMVSLIAAAQAIFLSVTANLVLLWSGVRFKGERGRVTYQRGRLLRVRRVVSGVSLLFWLGFMADVRPGSEAPRFWLVAVVGLILPLFVVVAIEELRNAVSHGGIRYRLFLLPLPGLWSDSFRWGPVLVNALLPDDLRPDDINPGLPKLLGMKVPRRAWRMRRRLIHGADWLLGPGFLDYRGQRPSRLLPGYMVSLAWLVLLFLIFEDHGLHFRSSGSLGYRYRLFDPSPLSMVLTGALLLMSFLAFMAFHADRFRLPVSVLLLGLIAFSTNVSWVDHVFFSEPVQSGALDDALTPRQVLEASPSKLIVVAAAGGGIQASGWTVQVLSGLREGKQGPAFKRALRVISGVSGGAVGAVFYAGTYDGVWSERAYSLEEARSRAMASSLDAALWGLVYPDLHRLLLPIPAWVWRGEDRGSSLERSIATRAGRNPGPTLLNLAPLVKEGFPVLLLNATLTEEAVPVTFTNSRYPGPQTTIGSPGFRNIRSFHQDFGLETRLETAARLSATFPIVSPAARPSEKRERDAFVDGGYFDNSGFYVLMGWLAEAADGLDGAADRKEVLLLLIDSFPEPRPDEHQQLEMPWYQQLTIPLETVMGVRASGQAARNRYEFPLLAKSLAQKLSAWQLEFRYRPSPQCAEKPPLSWHLTRVEQDCIRQAWNDPEVVRRRQQVSDWLGVR